MCEPKVSYPLLCDERADRAKRQDQEQHRDGGHYDRLCMTCQQPDSEARALWHLCDHSGQIMYQYITYNGRDHGQARITWKIGRFTLWRVRLCRNVIYCVVGKHRNVTFLLTVVVWVRLVVFCHNKIVCCAISFYL